MPIDSLIANPGRLKILTALASQPRQEFVHLRDSTRMSDGNLASHARRLQAAGLLDIDKSFRDGKPVTTFTLTLEGRGALESHVQRIVQALTPNIVSSEPEPIPAVQNEPNSELADDGEWID
jgi:DNA-binding MarR family transcriptional regulator